MMVLRPAAILGNERGTLVVLRGVLLDQAGVDRFLPSARIVDGLDSICTLGQLSFRYSQ